MRRGLRKMIKVLVADGAELAAEILEILSLGEGPVAERDLIDGLWRRGHVVYDPEEAEKVEA